MDNPGERLVERSAATAPTVPQVSMPAPSRPATAVSLARPTAGRWWRAFSRPAALAWLGVALLLQAVGAAQRLDEHVVGVLSRAAGPIDRGLAPTLVAIDPATVARLGPPPWSSPTWEAVLSALAAQGIQEVFLTDPWPRLVRPDALDLSAPGPLVRAPDTAWDGVGAPLPPGHPAWLDPAPSFALTAPGGGTVDAVAIPEEGWLPCLLHVPCRSGGSVRTRAADVPVISLVTLLDAPEGRLARPENGVLLGLTAPLHTGRVRVGPDGTAAPWSMAAATTIASGRQDGALTTPGTAGVVLWLLAVHGLVSLVVAVWPAASLGAFAPTLGAAAAIVSPGVLGVALPITASATAALAAPAGHAIAVGSAAVAQLRRLALLVVRAASRAGALRRRLGSLEEVSEALADLTRNHAQDLPYALLVVRGRQLVVHGGHGLEADDFRRGALSLGYAEVRAAAESFQGQACDALFADGSPGVLLPLRQAGRLVALWCIAVPPGRLPPDLKRVGRLARWMGERLALPGVGGSFTSDRAVLSTQADDEALEALFEAADEERRRWVQAVQAVGHPVLVADVSGLVSSLNPAMDAALRDAELPRVRSLRELVFRLEGEEHLGRRMRELFVDARTLRIGWSGERVLVVAPLGEPQTDGPGLFGFIAWLESVDPERTLLEDDDEPASPEAPTDRLGLT